MFEETGRQRNGVCAKHAGGRRCGWEKVQAAVGGGDTKWEVAEGLGSASGSSWDVPQRM